MAKIKLPDCIILLLLVLGLVACKSRPTDTTAQQPASTLQTNSTSMPQDDEPSQNPTSTPLETDKVDLSDTEDFQVSEADLPAFSPLVISPPITGVNEMITLSGSPGLTGEVVLLTSNGELPVGQMENGNADIEIPAGTGDRQYAIIVRQSDAVLAMGAIRIASQPGVWLETSRDLISPDGTVELRVTTYQVPEDSQMLLLVMDQPLVAQEVVQEAEYAFPAAQLVPTKYGDLRASGLEGAPISDFTRQPIRLPASLAGSIQVVVLDSEVVESSQNGNGEDEFLSEDMGLSYAESLGLASDPLSIQVCDQRAQIFGDLGGGGIVRVLAVGSMEPIQTVTTENGLFNASVLPGDLLIWGLVEKGFGFQRTPLTYDRVGCGQTRQVAMTGVKRSSQVFLASASNRELTQASGGGGEICRKVLISGMTSEEFQMEADILVDYWSAQIYEPLVRASLLTYLDIRSMLEVEQMRQLFGSENAGELIQEISGALGADIVLVGNLSQIGETYIAQILVFDNVAGVAIDRLTLRSPTLEGLLDLSPQIQEGIQKAALCPIIEPAEALVAPGESKEIELEITDLADESYGEVKLIVKSELKCGSLEWIEQSLAEREITNEYTANEDNENCREAITFEATATSPAGYQIEVPFDVVFDRRELWKLNVSWTYPTGLENGLPFQWEGIFYVNDENNLQGEGEGKIKGAYACEIIENDVTTYYSGPLDYKANWNMVIGGSYFGRTDPGRFDLVLGGSGWRYSGMPIPEQCASDLFFQMIHNFIKTVSYQPQILVFSERNPKLELQILAEDGAQETITVPELGGVLMLNVQVHQPAQD